MVGDLHGAVLFNPQLADYDVMNAAVDVTPGVGLAVTVAGGSDKQEDRDGDKE